MKVTEFQSMINDMLDVAEEYGVVGSDLDVLSEELWINMEYLITFDDRNYN